MGLESDLSLNASKFRTDAISQPALDANEHLISLMKGAPRWFDTGAEKYREMRWNGETPFPRPAVLDGKDGSIPSRESGRSISTRTFFPKSGSARAVFMHIHGGGWVLQSEHYQDTYLDFMAQQCGLVVVSIGYRLAPEHPFPAGPEDCYDAVDWLVDHSEEEFGAPLAFIGGESAGGHLASLACFYGLFSRPNFRLKGLLLHFGAYDLTMSLPQTLQFAPIGHPTGDTLILDTKLIERYVEAFCPGMSLEQRRQPNVSPMFADMRKLASESPYKSLPPALFTCGTEDPLLDDTVLMSSKWLMSGSEAVVKIYPGGPHGFVLFPPDSLESAREALDDTKTFVIGQLG